jgi:hypothetical protein
MSFIENVKKISTSIQGDKDNVIIAVKKDIERMASHGCNYTVFYPETFRSLLQVALGKNSQNDVSFETYHEMLYHVMTSLKKEGFAVSASFKTIEDGCLTGLYFHITWENK